MTKNDGKSAVWTYTIRLVAASVNGAAPDDIPDGISWSEIVDYADSHSVLNLVGYSAEKLQNAPPEYFAKLLKETKMKAKIVEAQQQIETQEALDKLEKMQVRHMPLKGFNIKDAYPMPDMRTMSDIDILIDRQKVDEVVSSFKEDGFEYRGEGDLHSVVNRNGIFFEFHRAMVDSQFEKLSAYFRDGFSRAVKCENCDYRYRLKHEDEYIFMIAHIAKHYRYGGTGIRTILDLYVYRRAYPDMDFEYISSELKKIGLDIFAKKAEALSENWFGGSFDGNFDGFAAYIASGGVYGSNENKLKNAFIVDNMKSENFSKKKFKNLIDLLFPRLDIMSVRYPVLKKYKFLLPFFYIVRFFETLFCAPENAKNRIRESVDIMRISKEQIDVQKKSGIDEL